MNVLPTTVAAVALWHEALRAEFEALMRAACTHCGVEALPIACAAGDASGGALLEFEVRGAREITDAASFEVFQSVARHLRDIDDRLRLRQVARASRLVARHASRGDEPAYVDHEPFLRVVFAVGGAPADAEQ